MNDPSQSTLALCLQWFSERTCANIDSATLVLNSNFTTALLGSLAGAFAGAIAAQHIVERNKTREELLKELRNTNAAAMASFTTCNAALRTKEQHVQPLYEQFQHDKAAVEAFKAERASGQPQRNDIFHFVSDMRIFPSPIIPIESLKDLLFNKLSVAGRPLSLVCAVEEASRGLEGAIATRLSLIEKMKSQVIPKELIPSYYFGFPLPDGDISQEYPDLVFAIHSYTDDLAFFSYLLCCDLTAHAKKLHAHIPKRLRKAAPNPVETDFTNERESGLIPPDSQYSDWLKAFPQKTMNQSPSKVARMK